MSKTISHILLGMGMLCLTGCKPSASDDSQPPPPTIPLSPTLRHAAIVAQAQNAAEARLESQVEREHSDRLQAEEQTRLEQASKSRWQIITFVTGASVVMLVVGTVIGTNTRHETKKE